MEGYFFKPRKNFDYRPNKYDLGTFFWSKKSHLDRLFLKKIVNLADNEYLGLYEYHKNFYLENHPEGREKIFFTKLDEFIKMAIDKEKKSILDEFSSTEKTKSEFRIKKYEAFIKIMKVKDIWNFTSDPSEGVKKMLKNIKAKQDVEQLLTNENKRLEEELAEIKNKYENLIEKYRSLAVPHTKRIVIKRGYFGTFINLLLELKEVEEPEQSEDNQFPKKIFETKAINTWVKLITNNFTEEGEEIVTSRVENYIVKGRRVPRNSYQCKIEISSKKVL
jgi:hypothetical protein